MSNTLSNLLSIVLPRRVRGGSSYTSSFSPDNTDQVLSAPDYRDHLRDLFTDRTAQDSRALMQRLFVQDPDVSAAVNAYLTAANTEPVFLVKDTNGQLDRAGQEMMNQIIQLITTRFDYSKGFQLKQTLRSINESLRYMTLLRGAVAGELVFDKRSAPTEIRIIDPTTLRWFEREPNKFVPQQEPTNSDEAISLDIPTFFVSFFRRDPTTIYSNSPFVSSINTIAARQQVINDIYRIMQVTGYPRMEVSVVEEVLSKNAPLNIRQDNTKLREWMNQQLNQIRNQISNLQADQAFIHTDSIKPSIMNERNPSNALNIDSIVGALNAMNQAGLRAMSTILGRGESGVNTASVETLIFSRNAEEINECLADFWSQLLTMAIRFYGSESHVECSFRGVELRPDLELENHRMMKASRLKNDLSLGIITDDEYHIEMYGRLRPDSAPILSGTNFQDTPSISVDETRISPNDDPMGRALTPDGSDMADSDATDS